MKILIVNRALATLFGGGESFDLNSARYLTRQGHDVTIVTGSPLLGKVNNQFGDVRVVHVSCPGLRRYAYSTEHISKALSAAFYHLDSLLFEWAVYRWLMRQPSGCFDVVQCCSLFQLPQWLIQSLKLPCISWLPGPPSGRARKAIRFLISAPHFGLFTHGSPKWALTKMKLCEHRDYRIIEPGVELAAIDQKDYDRAGKRRELHLSSSDLLGVTTARLVPVKNHLFLFKAICKARKAGVCWKWVVVGGGPLESVLRQQAAELGIESLVTFTGHQTQEEVHDWLNSADLFVLPSSYENFSIATLEAMAHRLPVIGTGVGYLQYLIADAGAGIIVSPSDSGELADALVRMKSAEIRKQFGKDGRVFVQQLDWPLITNKLEDLYKHVIKGRWS